MYAGLVGREGSGGGGGFLGGVVTNVERDIMMMASKVYYRYIIIPYERKFLLLYDHDEKRIVGGFWRGEGIWE